MNKPTITSEKPVFTSKLFTVIETRLTFGQKIKKTHHNAIRHQTVSVFPLNEKYDIYLVQQYRYLLGRETIKAMAGFVESNEKPLQAAKRELKEETGIEAKQWELLTKIDMSASVFKAEASLFLAKELEVIQQNQDETEDIAVIKMPLQKAVEKVMTGEIRTSATMIGILLLDKLRKEKKL